MSLFREMRQSHLIIYNTVIIWISRMLQIFPQIIIVPFLIGNIGDAGYGIYVLAWSLMLSIDQLEKSLQSGVTKFSAAFLAENRLEEVNKVLSTSFLFSLLLGGFACMGILSTRMLLDNPSKEMTFALTIIGIVAFFVIPITPFIGIIQSRQRHFVGTMAETCSKYLNLLAIFAWFKFAGPSVESLIVISCLLLFTSRMAQVPYAYRLVPGLSNQASLFDFKLFKRILSFGGVIVFASLCIVANTTGVRWLMGMLVSPGFVAHLAIMLMPGILMTQIVQAMTITVMPATSAYQATGNYGMLKELFIRGVRYIVILVTAGAIAGAILMKVFIVAWVGAKYEFLWPYALAVFSSVAFMLSSSGAHHMLKGMGKLRIVLINTTVGLLVVPFAGILSIFFIWKNPYFAIAAGLGAGNVVYGLMQLVFAMKAVKTGYMEIFLRAYAHTLAVGLAAGGIAQVTIAYLGIEGLWGTIGVASAAMASYFAAIYSLVATTAERRQFKDVAQRFFDRITATKRIVPEPKLSRER